MALLSRPVAEAMSHTRASLYLSKGSLVLFSYVIKPLLRTILLDGNAEDTSALGEILATVA